MLNKLGRHQYNNNNNENEKDSLIKRTINKVTLI